MTRIPSLKTVAAFRAHVAALGLELPCDEEILRGERSPLAAPVPGFSIGGKPIANRCVVQPMEGWDATVTGGVTETVLRRWQRFGASGAKMIFGGEAMAVRPDGRANPNQLVLSEANLGGLAHLIELAKGAHAERYGSAQDLVIGFQLTHSGRFCRPRDKAQAEPRVAFRHPLLDARFGVNDDRQVLSDDEVARLVEDFARAARLAHRAGADFVDIKHCHGYLLHEFLGAHTRPGRYGGSFENRTRPLRDIVGAIRADRNPIALAVRLSAFDFVPFRPDPALSQPGKPGPGIPVDCSACLPYRYGFGVQADCPVAHDLAEPRRFLALCGELGIGLVNLTAGSPYYNPHIQRPAAYPPSDGYQPAYDPLIDVARQIHAVRELRRDAPRSLVLIGTAYSYLQDYLPHVAQAVVRAGWVDLVGIGRMVLSYDGFFRDLLEQGRLQPKRICRTFSDCTTAPRNGLISGCYPLDDFYARRPEATALRQIKRGAAP